MEVDPSPTPETKAYLTHRFRVLSKAAKDGAIVKVEELPVSDSWGGPEVGANNITVNVCVTDILLYEW